MLEFIAQVAWPVAILVIALVYRPQIVGLMNRATGMKAGPLEVALAEARARVAGQAEPPGSAEFDAPMEDLRATAGSNPLSAILLAYDQVEEAVRQRMRGQVPKDVDLDRLSGTALLDVLREHEAHNPRLLDAVRGVRVVRNMAAHNNREPTYGEALDYLTLVDSVHYALSIKPRLASAA